MKKILYRVLIRGFGIITFLLAVGTLFFMYVEGLSPIDAFYYAGTTLTTLGSSPYVPQTSLGKISTVLYTMIGIGILFYVIGKLFHLIFSKTLLDPIFHERHQLFYTKLLRKKIQEEIKSKKKK